MLASPPEAPPYHCSMKHNLPKYSVYILQDLNPTENLWGTMKWYLRKHVKPKTKEELIQGIKQFWALVTPQMCTRYIRHIDKVVPVVIARREAASGY